MTTATEPRERGILFSDRLVRAILDGRKTQTRRIVKRVGNDNCLPLPGRMKTHVLDAPARGLCPYGVPGDRLYVREAHQIESSFNVDLRPYDPPFDDGRPIRHHEDEDWGDWWEQCHYRATDPCPELVDPDGDRFCRWRPSIHMPKWATRIWLEITGVRVERVQEITPEDVAAEGAILWASPPGDRVERYADVKVFADLWDDTNGHRDGCTWDANPWVWVIQFRRMEP